MMKRIKAFNEFLATNITLAFGTMWTTYIFFLYGFGPIIWPQAMSKMLYWSNTVQLWSLPLLMVGTNILGRKSERRNAEMYEMIKEEFKEIRNLKQIERDELDQIKSLCENCNAYQEREEKEMSV